MEIHGWVIIQTVIDFVLMALLLGTLWSFRKRPLPRQEYEEVVKRSEAILAEMKQIGLMLEKNLHEKKEISRHLLDQLDQGLARRRPVIKKLWIYNRGMKSYSKPSRRSFPQRTGGPLFRPCPSRG